MDDDLRNVALAELVAGHPARAGLLDRLGLDYCCGGLRTLADACVDAGLDPAEVSDRLTGESAGDPEGWEELGPVELADRIVATHHRYLRAELPELERLAEKVRAVHGERHPELEAVSGLVRELRAELEPHLDGEEQLLFPAVRVLAADPGGEQAGVAVDAVTTLAAEHDRAGALLARMRDTTGGYAVPGDGCASYRALYERLEHLEGDTHLHVHRENYRLFPAVMALAAGSPGTWP